MTMQELGVKLVKMLYWKLLRYLYFHALLFNAN